MAVQVNDLGKGSFGVTKLMRSLTGELFAVKFIDRGSKVRRRSPPAAVRSPHLARLAGAADMSAHLYLHRTNLGAGPNIR